MMSILFIAMLRRRGSLRGQSFLIALTKTAGSALAGFTAWKGGRIPPGTALLPVLILATLAWNLCYALLVYHRARRDGISLWRHSAASSAWWSNHGHGVILKVRHGVAPSSGSAEIGRLYLHVERENPNPISP